MDLSGPQRKAESSRHWSQVIQETLLSVGLDGPFGIVVSGGAENGQFCWISDVDVTNIIYYTGKLHRDEVILEIQGQKVAGYTLHDLQEWLLLATNNNSPVLIKTIVTGSMTKDLREFLNTRFQKASLDHNLQQTIRNNIYKRTVPCTTRPPRPGEVDGVDYKFLSLEEFSALEKSGNLLESGVFDGNYYGTPKPPKVPTNNESPFRRAGSMGNIVPGQHPSSEGKRRRNRSNIETNVGGNSSGDVHPKEVLEQMKSMEGVHGGQENLNPLPSSWEKGITTNGRQYLVDRGAEPGRWMGQRQTRSPMKDESNELLPGWERVDDPVYGVYYIDHINKKTQYEIPLAKGQQRPTGRDGQQDDQPDSPSSGLFSDKSSDRAHQKAVESWNNGHRSAPAYGVQRYVFTRNPAELRGDFVSTRLVKTDKGLGFTIIGGDDNNEEFLQIKTILPNGAAYEDGKLQRSDILVYINDQCVLGHSHQDIITLFQSIPIGECVTLEVCRGYPLPFDPDDPNNEIITTVAVTLPSSKTSTTNVATYSDPSQGRSSKTGWTDERSSRSKSPYVMAKAKSVDDQSDESAPGFSSSQLQAAAGLRPELHKVNITKGRMGFGFTIADSVYGQKVKQILDRPRCKILQEGDILVEINGIIVKDLTHGEVVQVLKNCPLGAEAAMTVQRGGIPSRSRARKPSGKSSYGLEAAGSGPQWNEDSTAFKKNSFPDAPMRPNIPNYMEATSQVPGRQRYSDYVDDDCRSQPIDKVDAAGGYLMNSGSSGYDYGYGIRSRNVAKEFDDRSASSYGTPPRRDFVNQMSFNEFDKKANVVRSHSRSKTPGPELMRGRTGQDADALYAYRHAMDLRSKTPTQGIMSQHSKPISGTPDFIPASRYQTPSPLGRVQAYDIAQKKLSDHALSNVGPGLKETLPLGSRVGGAASVPVGISTSMYGNLPGGGAVRPITPSLKQLNQESGMKMSTSFENVEPVSGGAIPRDGWIDSPGGSIDSRSPMRSNFDGQDYELSVRLIRHESGFGFRIIGGTEEGSQVSVGHIVPGGAADIDGRLLPGDEIIYIDNICVIGASHHKVVQLMGQSSNIGHVTLRVRRRVPFGGVGVGGGGDLSMAGMKSGHMYDVTLTRREGEGFGFVIISSVTRSGSVIGKLVEGSPADRSGKLHVGSQILAVNHINITQMLHEQIVNLIKESGYNVTLTVGAPDDTSSISSATQRSASVPPTSLGFQTQSESDMSRHSEYSPYHNSSQSRIPPYSMEPSTRDLHYQHAGFTPQMSAPDLSQGDKFYSIELQRGSRGFGFSIRGGKEFNNMPLFILKIAEGGAADVDGQLKVGDQIIEINGYNTNNMTHANAIDLIQTCNSNIRLLVKRSGKPLPGLSASQLPSALQYLHNGLTNANPSISNDLRISNNPQERGYLYGQGSSSQRYQSSYR